MNQTELKVESVSVSELRPAEYNPRTWTKEARRNLSASIDAFGFVQPIVVNSAPNRKGVIIGGNFKLDIAKERGMEKVPVVWVNLPDIDQEKELNIRLNKNQGDFDLNLLASFNEEMLKNIGFTDAEMKDIFDEPISYSVTSIAFNCTEDQIAIIKSAIEKASDYFDDVVPTGKRGKVRNADYLVRIINAWTESI